MPTHFKGENKHYILDLSVPENVHPGVKDVENVQVVGLDAVSQKMQDTLAMRKREVPKANAIIAGYLELFSEWLAMYQYKAVIYNFKASLFCDDNNLMHEQGN